MSALDRLLDCGDPEEPRISRRRIKIGWRQKRRFPEAPGQSHTWISGLIASGPTDPEAAGGSTRVASLRVVTEVQHESGLSSSDESCSSRLFVTEVNTYRTLFLSDIHLGSRNCQADLLLDFLRNHDAETIYLVGDIFDGWRLKRSWYWPQSHNDVVQKFLRKVRKGARVVYIPGNHDDFVRAYAGMFFGGVEIAGSAIHELADGRRFLVVHGDEFDLVARHARWLALVGDWAYEVALNLNASFNRLRRLLGFEYWSFSAWAKFKVKNAVNFISAFESALILQAERLGVDGVVCGHIHHPCIQEVGPITYVNTGDFVESCTALLEHHNGWLEIVRWQISIGEPSSAEADSIRAAAA